MIRGCTFLKPVVSEKSLKRVEDCNEYTFLVARGATKFQVKGLVADIFNVEVRSVRVGVGRGRKRRVGKRGHVVSTSDFKKVFVELEEGGKIDLFDTKEAKKTLGSS